MKNILIAGWLLLGFFPSFLSADGSENQAVVSEALSTPTLTLETFIQSMGEVIDGNSKAMDHALNTFDLNNITTVIRKDRGSELAYSLYSIIQHDQLQNAEFIIQIVGSKNNANHHHKHF